MGAWGQVVQGKVRGWGDVKHKFQLFLVSYLKKLYHTALHYTIDMITLASIFCVITDQNGDPAH